MGLIIHEFLCLLEGIAVGIYKPFGTRQQKISSRIDLITVIWHLMFQMYPRSDATKSGAIDGLKVACKKCRSMCGFESSWVEVLKAFHTSCLFPPGVLDPRCWSNLPVFNFQYRHMESSVICYGSREKVRIWKTFNKILLFSFNKRHSWTPSITARWNKDWALGK